MGESKQEPDFPLEPSEKLQKRFKPGDVVRAKFSVVAPRMTIAWYMANRTGGRYIPYRCFCQWFIDSKLQEGIFPEASLELNAELNKQQEEERKPNG